MFIKFFVITVSVILFIIIPAIVLLAILGAILLYEWAVVLVWIIPWLMLVNVWLNVVKSLYLKSKKVKIIINENTVI